MCKCFEFKEKPQHDIVKNKTHLHTDVKKVITVTVNNLNNQTNIISPRSNIFNRHYKKTNNQNKRIKTHFRLILQIKYTKNKSKNKQKNTCCTFNINVFYIS